MLALGTGRAEGVGSTTGGAPIAESDHFVVPAGDALTGSPPGVLANDVDPDGDAIYAQLVSGAANGLVDLGVFGEVSYTPNIGFAGLDSFQYQAFDGTLASAPATVEITVERLEVIGTARSERLTGTENAEIFRTLGGERHHLFLGGGMDVVALEETHDGIAGLTRIFGFGPDDRLDLGGASIAAVRDQKNGWLRLTLDGDGDIILLEGVTWAEMDSLI